MKVLSEALEIDAQVVDGAAAINMLKPTHGKTFREGAINISVPYISNVFRQVEPMDLVWDRKYKRKTFVEKLLVIAFLQTTESLFTK